MLARIGLWISSGIASGEGVGGPLASTSENEVLWDNTDPLAWDDGDLVAWD